MLAERIQHDAAGAGVSLADCTTQAETDGHAYDHAYGVIIIIIHAKIKVTLSQKCCRGTVQLAMSHITCLQSQEQ